MTKPPKPQTAALYARYSSDNQREASIDDQLRRCREKAASEGWEVSEIYTDAAVSGSSMMRDGIQRLMMDSRKGQFTLILTEALDRLSRNQADIASIYQNLKFAEVEMRPCTKGGSAHRISASKAQ